MASIQGVGWVRITTVALAVAITATAAVVSGFVFKQKCRRLASRIRELEASLGASLEKGAAERRGRVRAQQALRKALAEQSVDGPKQAPLYSYPMVPIGTVRSCFSTRNGTPRQPLLVPLARACLQLNPARVPAEALEGLTDYSHCWILYVFNLNTDLDKMWKEPSRSKLKAKVRVPRLKGGKMGVFATRSPHRPCPIGLSVAQVEALDGHAVLLSGIDLVDGTPVLDIKPYLPYSDSVKGATIPDWLKADSALLVASITFSANFAASLSNCWVRAEKQSLYASAEEFQSLIKEVLTWDIRSLSTRNCSCLVMGNENHRNDEALPEDGSDEEVCQNPSSAVVYHLILECIDVSYRIDEESKVTVEDATLLSDVHIRNNCGQLIWRNRLERVK